MKRLHTINYISSLLDHQISRGEEEPSLPNIDIAYTDNFWSTINENPSILDAAPPGTKLGPGETLRLRLADLKWRTARKNAWESDYKDLAEPVDKWALGRTKELLQLMQSGAKPSHDFLEGLRDIGMKDDPSTLTIEYLRDYFSIIFYPLYACEDGLENLVNSFIRPGGWGEIKKDLSATYARFIALEPLLKPILQDVYSHVLYAIYHPLETYTNSERENESQRLKILKTANVYIQDTARKPHPTTLTPLSNTLFSADLTLIAPKKTKKTKKPKGSSDEQNKETNQSTPQATPATVQETPEARPNGSNRIIRIRDANGEIVGLLVGNDLYPIRRQTVNVMGMSQGPSHIPDMFKTNSELGIRIERGPEDWGG